MAKKCQNISLTYIQTGYLIFIEIVIRINQLDTVFPHIVAAATILFSIHLVRKLFNERKLFKGGNYLRKYGNYIIETKRIRQGYQQIFYSGSTENRFCSNTLAFDNLRLTQNNFNKFVDCILGGVNSSNRWNSIAPNVKSSKYL